MGKVKKTTTEQSRTSPPALSPELEESKAIALAMKQAQKQLEEGTASPSVIVHFLKRASYKEKEDLENERLRNEVQLLKAKTEALESQKHVEELYADAMKAFKTYYSGTSSEDEYDADI
jgi:hypothetical protein